MMRIVATIECRYGVISLLEIARVAGTQVQVLWISN
jgi:hypothetical protein